MGAPFPIHSKAGGRAATSTPKEIETKIETIELVSQTYFHSSTQNPIPVLTVQDYPKVHRLVMNLFKTKIKAGIPLAGRTKRFLENWKQLTQDPSILEIVQGYKIPFIEFPRQTFLPRRGNLTSKEKELVGQEISQMLTKGAISKVRPSQDQFLSNIFILPKKDGGNRPVINLKHLNSFINCPHFKMEVPIVPICQSLFWSITCTTNIHKIIKNPNDPIKEVKNKTQNLSRRYSFDGLLKSGSGDCQGYIDFSITTSGIRNQCEKISLNPSKKDRISGNHHRFGEDGNVLIRSKSSEIHSEVSKNVGQEEGFHKGDFSVDRDIIIDGCSSSSSSIQISSKTSDTGIKFLSILRKTDSSVSSRESKDRMVDKQHSTEQWKVPCVETTPATHKVRCLERRMGGLLPGREDRGALVKQGKRLAHKYFGIKSSKICNLNIHPEQELPQQHTHSNGQHDSSMLFSKNGGRNKQSGASEIKQTNLEPFDFIGDHSYCRTSPRDSKYRSGLRVKECEGLQRVEAREQDFSKTLQEIRVPKDKSICLKSIQTAKEILFLENRPFQCRQGCVSSKLVQVLNYAFPLFNLIGRVLAKVQRERSTLILITPAWQTQSWFPKVMEMAISIPVLLLATRIY